MSAIRSSPAGQALLVDHRLEPFDVGPRRLLERGRRVEARPQLCRLVGEVARRQRDPEVPPECLEQRHRGGRVRTRDVVRDLGEVAERTGRPPSTPRTRAPRRRRTARAGCRPVRRATSDFSSPGRDSVPRIGTGRVCGTAAGMAPRLIHSLDPESPDHVDDVAHELAPAVVGLRARRGRAGRGRRPASGARRASARSARSSSPVDDLQRRSSRPVVEDPVGIEGRDDGRVLGQQGRAPRSPTTRHRPSRRTRPAASVRRGRPGHRGDRGSPLKDRRRAMRIQGDAWGQPGRAMISPEVRTNQPSGEAAQSRQAVGDRGQLVAVCQARFERLVGERGACHAVRPERSPPRSFLRGREAPHARRRGHVREAGRVRPGEEAPTGRRARPRSHG